MAKNGMNASRKKKASKKPKKVKYVRNVAPDMPDTRDWLYQPSLNPIPFPKVVPAVPATILDQGKLNACTGYALASVINHLMHQSGRPGKRVSARMLYMMARLHDEWPGEADEGSSIRAAIVGWENMGVCLEAEWPEGILPREDKLTIDRARDARNYTLGAYYRLAPKIEHFHAALCETGILYASALTHAGWEFPCELPDKPYPFIKPEGETEGGHAFAIVGYNEDGFLIQNSWAETWGRKGLAIWTYEDWNEHLMDAWVVQLAYPTPMIFGLEPQSAFLADVVAEKKRRGAPNRGDIAGHFVHIDDGRFHEKGKYWSTKFDTEQTAEEVANKGYKNLLLYAHGGLNSPEDSARRIFALKDGFKRNGVYPYHVMYDVGLGEEIKDILSRKFSPFDRRTGGWLSDARDKVSDFVAAWQRKLVETADETIENLVRKPITPIWEEIKRDAEVAFAASGAGTQTLDLFLKAFENAPNGEGATQVHMVGHSTGAVVLAHLIDRMEAKKANFHISTLSLFAPACTVALFNKSFLPALKRKSNKNVSIGQLNIYALTDELELKDNVAGLYRKSLLYMVSNALEREKGKAILGMRKFHHLLPKNVKNLRVYYSNPEKKSAETQSKSHGGFDNDANTLNHLLRVILEKRAAQGFTQKELRY